MYMLFATVDIEKHLQLAIDRTIGEAMQTATVA